MPESKLSAFCGQIIEAGWLAAIVVAPLFFNVYSNRNIEPDKVALVCALAAMMAAAWFVRWIDQRRSPHAPSSLSLRSPMVLPVLLVVAVYLLTTITSIVPRVSFFGEYVRPEGTWTMICYVVVFAMIAQGLRKPAQLDRIIFAIILTSLPVALYAIIQKLGLDPLAWDNTHLGRGSAGVGNPIFLAAYLAMSFFASLAKILQCARTIAKPEGQVLNRIRIFGYGLVSLFQLAAIVFSDSRGPWLGWLGGLFLFGLLLAVLRGNRRFVAGVLGVSTVGALFILVLNLPVGPAAALRSLPYVDRLGSILQDTGSARVRTLIWQADTQLMSSGTPIQFPDGSADSLNAIRPLVGFGPDSMRFVFSQVYPAELGTLESRDNAYVRSHNETWDWIVNAGVLGFLVYQFLILSLFFYGLRWLGLISTDWQRNAFVALWLGLGTFGGIACILLGKPNYLGLAIPMGNAAAIALYLLISSLRSKEGEQPAVDWLRQFLLVALLGALFSNYIESQFGIPVAATRVSFWVFAGLLVVLGANRITVEDEALIPAPVARKRTELRAAAAPRSLPTWVGAVIGYALPIVLVLAILFYEFCTFAGQPMDALAVLWRGLTYNPLLGMTSFAILGLMLAVWVIATVLALCELADSGAVAPRNWRAASGLFAAVTLGVPLAFGFGLAVQLSALGNAAAQTVPDALARSDQFAGLFNYLVSSLFLLVGLGAGAIMLERKLSSRWATSRLSLVAVVLVLLLAGAWISAYDVNPIRADIIYKVAQDSEKSNPQSDTIVALYEHAVQTAPGEDVYYNALGLAFRERAKDAKSNSASIFSDQTPLAAIVNQSPEQTAKLNRNDLLYASLTMLLRSRDLNPLIGEYAVNLARFYLPNLPIDTQAKLDLARQSDRYYAEAVRLSPNDIRVWNEWANFDLAYMTDDDAALAKVEKSIQLDPTFAPSYVALGTVYAEKHEFDQAAEAFHKALALDPNQTEAQSKLAFVYYQQGRDGESIQAYLKYIDLAQGAQNLWEAHKNLALIYQQTGNRAGAIHEGQIAADLAPRTYASQLTDWVNQLQGH